MIVKIGTCAVWGLDGFEVVVEAFLGKGAFEMEIIGLPDLAVKESQSRITSALLALKLPAPSGKVTVNLAPADRKKQGSGFDLPILMALLSMTALGGMELGGNFFFGELGLDGSLRGGTGALPKALAARDAGAKVLFVPKENEKECSVVEGLTVFGAEHVTQILDHLLGRAALTPAVFDREAAFATREVAVDFADIRGQALAKRALEIAAAGNHNLLLVGPPGSGKVCFPRRFPESCRK